MKLIKHAVFLALILGIANAASLSDEVKAINDKYAEHIVDADPDGLAGIVTDGVISTMYGKPPTFGKTSFKVAQKAMFAERVYARMVFTQDGVGETNNMIYAWGLGTGNSTTAADATPLGKSSTYVSLNGTQTGTYVFGRRRLSEQYKENPYTGYNKIDYMYHG